MKPWLSRVSKVFPTSNTLFTTGQQSTRHRKREEDKARHQCCHPYLRGDRPVSRRNWDDSYGTPDSGPELVSGWATAHCDSYYWDWEHKKHQTRKKECQNSYDGFLPYNYFSFSFVSFTSVRPNPARCWCSTVFSNPFLNTTIQSYLSNSVDLVDMFPTTQTATNTVEANTLAAATKFQNKNCRNLSLTVRCYRKLQVLYFRRTEAKARN